MKKKTIFYLALLLISILLFYFLFYHSSLTQKQESFIPKIIKESYRPFERNVRNKYKTFYHHTSTKLSNMFRPYF